ncbi:hypothetical protein MCOR25_007869, partial [Pyricularia grisea]
MHASSLLFLMASLTGVLGDNITLGVGSTGGLCCDHGTEDPSGTCKRQGLTPYG